MDNTELYLSPLDMSLSLCSTIKQMAGVAKSSKRNCQVIAERVKVLEGLILTLKKREHEGLSEPVQASLRELCRDLKSARTLMERVSQNNSLASLKFKNHDYQFSNMNERLIDNFQALSGFFLIEQGKNDNTMGPTAQMPQPSSMYPMDPTAKMPQPSSMYPMDPTAQMPQPSSMYPMDPTAKMPQPSTTPSMMFNPTAQMPQPSTMASMMFNPTAQMPQPSTMASMMFNPTAQMPQPSTTPSMSMYTSAPPYPSQAMSDSISPLSSIPSPNQTDHHSNMCMMAPMNVPRQTNPVVPNYGFLS